MTKESCWELTAWLIWLGQRCCLQLIYHHDQVEPGQYFPEKYSAAIYNTADMRVTYAVWCHQKLVESVQCQTPNNSHGRQKNAIHQKCQHHALLYILGETSQHQESFHHSMHPCQMRIVSGNNQLLPWKHRYSNHSSLEMEAECLTKTLSNLNLNISRKKIW